MVTVGATIVQLLKRNGEIMDTLAVQGLELIKKDCEVESLREKTKRLEKKNADLAKRLEESDQAKRQEARRAGKLQREMETDKANFEEAADRNAKRRKKMDELITRAEDTLAEPARVIKMHAQVIKRLHTKIVELGGTVGLIPLVPNLDPVRRELEDLDTPEQVQRPKTRPRTPQGRFKRTIQGAE